MGFEPRLVTSIDELQKEVDRADWLGKQSDEDMRRHFQTFRFDLPSIKDDPFSDTYRSEVLAQYEQITGRKFELENEHTAFDFEAALVKPFPFNSNSPGLTADYFTMIADLVRVLGRTSGAVADMGAGWGHTSEMLASLGMDVHAVDMNPDFCRLIKTRCEARGLRVNTINGDFFAVEQAPDIDAAVFFESFHHCLDHLKLLQVLHEKMPLGGTIVFSGEPIERNWRAPWGLRMDGMSMWSIRKFGWLELGFDEDYFLEALLRTGWVPERIDHPSHGPSYRGTKSGVYLPARVMWPSSCGWAPAETDPTLDFRFTSDHTEIPFPKGTATVTLKNIRPTPMTVVVNWLKYDLPPGVATRIPVKCKGRILIECDAWRPAEVFRNPDMRKLGVAVLAIETG